MNKTETIKSQLPIQASMKIGRPGDKYEQEADRVADYVMRSSPVDPIQMQTEEEEEELQMKCENCEEDELQMKPELQIKNGTSFEASPDVSNKIKSTKGTGSALTPTLQREMSTKIKADFSGVNIHTGSDAVQMNRELGARAFTQGKDIYFNSGEYNPNSSNGKHLLAHELTHVMQQADGVQGTVRLNSGLYSRNLVQRDGEPGHNPSSEGSVWHVLIGDIWTLVASLKQAQDHYHSATRQDWIRELSTLMRKAGHPGEVTDAQLLAFTAQFETYYDKIKKQHDSATAQWPDLKARTQIEIGQLKGEVDDASKRALSIIQHDLQKVERAVSRTGEYLTVDDLYPIKRDVDEGYHHVSGQAYANRKKPFHGVKADPSLGDVWIGIGFEVSGDLFIAGRHSTTAYLLNVGDAPPMRTAWIEISGWKIGPGLGGSFSAVVVIANGPKDFGDLKKLKTSDWDYTAALGARLKSVIDVATGAPRTASAIKNASDIDQLRKLSKTAIGLGFGQRAGSIDVFGIPAAGAGLHVWAGHKGGSLEVASIGRIGEK